MKYLILFFILLTGCSGSESHVNQKIPVINLEDISADPIELRLSNVVTNLTVVPLETTSGSLIGGTKVVASEQFFLVASNQAGDAARLFRFDRTGKFLNQIGRIGGGPGEHMSSFINYVHYYEKDNIVVVVWMLKGKPQIFKPDGTFIGEINSPYRNVFQIERWNDSIWMSPNTVKSQFQNRIDSSLFSFYTAKGQIVGLIKRSQFRTQKNVHSLVLGSPIPNPYIFFYDNEWKFHSQENDTIYKISTMKFIPDAVISSGGTGVPFFEPSINVNEIKSVYEFNILRETKNDWFIERIGTQILYNGSFDRKTNTITREPVMTTDESSAELIIVNKKSGIAKLVKWKDDILDDMLTEPLNAHSGGQGNNKSIMWYGGRRNEIILTVQAFDVPNYVRKLEARGLKIKPEITTELEKLKGIKETDNPVIFILSLKEELPFN